MTDTVSIPDDANPFDPANAVVSYRVRTAASDPWSELVDVVTENGDNVLVTRLPGRDTVDRIRATAPNLDVVRRVSSSRLSDDALSYVVTFVNHEYRTPGGRSPRHQVELWYETPVDVRTHMEEIAWDAASLWPGSGWGYDDDEDAASADSAWWVENITTPEGDLVKPEM